MSPKVNEVQFTVCLSTDVLERLKSMAEHADISRHKLMRNLLQEGIEEIKTLDHVGIFQLAIIIRNIAESPAKAKARKSGETETSEMPVPIRIEKTYVDLLKGLAEKGDITRQRLAQNIIKIGLEELESLRKYKLTNIIIKIRDMHNLFTDFLETGKQAFYAGKEVKPK